MKILKNVIHKFGKQYVRDVLCKKEFQSQKFKKINERPIEYGFVFKVLSRVCPKEVLDIGTGLSSLPHMMMSCGYITTAIDNVYDYWSGKLFNRHFYIINDDIRSPKIRKKFDLITCISAIEHINDHNKVMESIFALLNPNGHIILTTPYNEKKYIQNVYKLPEAGYGKDWPWICQIFSRKELLNWLAKNNGKIIEQEYWQVFTGDLWSFGDRLYPPKLVEKNQKHQLTCLWIQKE